MKLNSRSNNRVLSYFLTSTLMLLSFQNCGRPSTITLTTQTQDTVINTESPSENTNTSSATQGANPNELQNEETLAINETPIQTPIGEFPTQQLLSQTTPLESNSELAIIEEAVPNIEDSTANANANTPNQEVLSSPETTDVIISTPESTITNSLGATPLLLDTGYIIGFAYSFSPLINAATGSLYDHIGIIVVQKN